jgi:hypothetical protein
MYPNKEDKCFACYDKNDHEKCRKCYQSDSCIMCSADINVCTKCMSSFALINGKCTTSCPS